MISLRKGPLNKCCYDSHPTIFWCELGWKCFAREVKFYLNYMHLVYLKIEKQRRTKGV